MAIHGFRFENMDLAIQIVAEVSVRKSFVLDDSNLLLHVSRLFLTTVKYIAVKVHSTISEGICLIE